MSEVESHASDNSNKMLNIPSPETAKSKSPNVERIQVSQSGQVPSLDQQDFFNQLNDKLNASIEHARVETRSSEKNLNTSKIPLPSGLANPGNVRDNYDLKKIQKKVADLADTGGKFK